MLVKKVQEYTDKFSSEISKAFPYKLEDIIVKPGQIRNDGILMSTVKGIIFIHNFDFQYTEGALEHHVLHELGHRFAASINKDSNSDLAFKVGYGITKKSEKGLLNKIKSELGFSISLLETLMANPGCEDVAKSLTEGIAEYFALLVLPYTCCTVSDNCKNYGMARSVLFMDEVRRIKRVNEIIKKSLGRPVRNFKEIFEVESGGNKIRKYKQLGRYGQKLKDHSTTYQYSLGFNLYYQMARKKSFESVIRFVKEPYIEGDPKLSLEKLIDSDCYVDPLLKNREIKRPY